MGPTVTNSNSCLETDGVMESQGSQDCAMEESPSQRKGDRMPFQIFPDPVDTEGSLCQPPERERLPSIVVEPTDVSEVESGELRWPPEDVDQEDDEDLFLEQCIPPANIADWAKDEEEDEEEDEDEDEDTEAEEVSIVLSDQQCCSFTDQNEEEFQDDAPALLADSTPALN